MYVYSLFYGNVKKKLTDYDFTAFFLKCALFQPARILVDQIDQKLAVNHN